MVSVQATWSPVPLLALVPNYSRGKTDVNFDDDYDDDIDLNDKDLKPSKKAYEVNFKVYSPNEIQQHQDAQINEVSNILEQPPERTAILMRQCS